MISMIIEELYKIIGKRMKELPAGSYVASLVKEGEDRVIQKVGEEAVEVVLAAKNINKQRIVEEIADLYFMTLVLMAVKEITLPSVYKELEKRKKPFRKQTT